MHLDNTLQLLTHAARCHAIPRMGRGYPRGCGLKHRVAMLGKEWREDICCLMHRPVSQSSSALIPPYPNLRQVQVSRTA